MFISEYEKQYMKALRDIYENGYSDGVNERTGVATKRLPGIVFRVDVEKEFPILKSKKVPAKICQREIEWIWKDQSNNINDLDATIWDEWADENGSIGKAYGYQARRPVSVYLDITGKDKDTYRYYKNQMKFVVEYLRENPNGRWAVATLLNPQEMCDMNLVPCCHTCTFNLDGGRLNCVLDQRSGDMPYGVPFNTTQYAMLMCMIARDLGVKPGILTHVIADAHIYDRQMQGVEKQLEIFELMQDVADRCSDEIVFNKASLLWAKYDDISSKYASPSGYVYRMVAVLRSRPHFEVYAEETDMFAYREDECKVEDYRHMDVIKFGDIVV